jgi:acetyltransferase-like isoleucine patch superfamily enzyme
MRNLIKSIIVVLKNMKNKISISSNISFNTQIGIGNIVLRSAIINTVINNKSQFISASIYSGNMGNENKIEGATLYSTNTGDHVTISHNTTITNSVIGRYTYLAGNNRVFNAHIGAFCSIAENVSIGHAEHPYTEFSTSPVFYKEDNPFLVTKFVKKDIAEYSKTVIGNDVWIGLNAYIKTGITIGDGCIIGAGAVVTKNVDPYSIVAGVPAKLIKKRFDDKTIKQLQTDNWWNMSEDELLQYTNRNR